MTRLRAGCRRSFPFRRVHDLSVPDHRNSMRCRLHFRVSGLPIPPTRCACKPGPRVNETGLSASASRRRHIQYSRLLKSVEPPNRGGQEVAAQKRKNPGDAFRHQPGFSSVAREVPVGQVTSRNRPGGLPHTESCQITGGPVCKYCHSQNHGPLPDRAMHITARQAAMACLPGGY